uniref:Uncharacterized protein n=1 Tax=Arundo donax TaxID=35708 RepID=A0A0A9HJY8_ARUDO
MLVMQLTINLCFYPTVKIMRRVKCCCMAARIYQCCFVYRKPIYDSVLAYYLSNRHIHIVCFPCLILWNKKPWSAYNSL